MQGEVETKSDRIENTAPTPSRVASETLAQLLDRLTATGSLCREESGKIRCVACGHRCLVGAGRRGICKVRYNQDGQLRVPFGYVAGIASLDGRLVVVLDLDRLVSYSEPLPTA